MTFDGSISVSQIFQTIVMIGGLLYAIWAIKAKLDLLIQETGLRHQSNIEKFEIINGKLKDLTTTIVELAKQEIRMNTIDERLQELSNRISKKRQISR